MLYRFLKVAFHFIYSLLFRCEVHGAENLPAEGPVIVAANHMSNWDPPLLGTYARRHISFMAKEELFRPPGLGWALRSCEAFPVKRGAADRSAIKTALQILKEGRCMALFPEGTRSRTGKMGKAEAGIGLIAAMSKAAVVPAAIIGTDKIFNHGHYFPKLKIIYGKPVRFTGAHNDKAALQEFSQGIMDEIAKIKKEYEES